MENVNLLKRSSTVQTVLNKLRNDIVLYKYKNNQQIKEVALTEKYDCSRAAVRSALVVLEKEGLIIAQENGTKVISCLTAQDIDNLYDLRLYIEMKAIHQIFDNHLSDISPIFNAASEIRTASHDNVDETLEIDMLFHTAVIKASGNKALIQAWNNIAEVLRVLFTLNMNESEAYKEEFLNSFKARHIELAGALLSDREKALRLFEAHIKEAHERSLRVIVKFQTRKE